jgi:hypothetical protein
VFGSVSCVGKTKSTNSEVLQNFYQKHLTPNELLQIRRKALSGIQDLIVDSAAMERRLNEPLSRVQPDPLTHTPMESLGDQIKKKKGNSWIGKSKENSRELSTDATLPPDETLESIPNVPPVQIEYSSVSLYNTDAMLKACDTNVLLIGTPAFDHRTSLWVLKWPMYPKVVHLSPEASAAIANLSQTPSLLGLKGHLKQLSASGDVYELSDFVGLVHGLHPELFREKSETSVIFSKWGYSLAHQLHQWRKRNTKVIEFSDSAPAESSHPDSVNPKTEDSQSVIKPEPSPVVHPPKSPAEPKFQPPTPPTTNPQPRVIKPPSPVDKTSHEKPSSTANQSPTTGPIQEPERSHAGSERNSKWAIVWAMAAVASLLAVISQIL